VTPDKLGGATNCAGCDLRAEVVRLLARLDQVMMAPVELAAQAVADAIWSGASDERVSKLRRDFKSRRQSWHESRDLVVHQGVMAALRCTCPAGAVDLPPAPTVEVPEVTARPNEREYLAHSTGPERCVRCGRQEDMPHIAVVGVCSKCFGRES
jgi:hypothetical protein